MIIRKIAAVAIAFISTAVWFPHAMTQDEVILDSELILVSPGQTVDWKFTVNLTQKAHVKGLIQTDQATSDPVWTVQGCIGGFCFMTAGGPDNPLTGTVNCQMRLYVPSSFTGEDKTGKVSMKLVADGSDLGWANLHIMSIKPLKANFVAGEKPIQVFNMEMENCIPTKTLSENMVVSKSAPTIIKGSMMIPFRILGEIIGAQIGWNANTNEASYVLGPKKVVLRKEIGKARVVFTGFEKSIEVKPPPANINGNIMVPLRFVTNALGGAVFWDAPTKTATIQFPGCQR